MKTENENLILGFAVGVCITIAVALVVVGNDEPATVYMRWSDQSVVRIDDPNGGMWTADSLPPNRVIVWVDEREWGRE